jgi:hypothetical protein
MRLGHPVGVNKVTYMEGAVSLAADVDRFHQAAVGPDEGVFGGAVEDAIPHLFQVGCVPLAPVVSFVRQESATVLGGDLDQWTGKCDLAVESYKKALELDPKNAEVLEILKKIER